MNSKIFFVLFLIPTFLYTTKPQPPLALPTTALAGANAEIAKLKEENAKLAKQVTRLTRAQVENAAKIFELTQEKQTLTAVVGAQAARLTTLKQLQTAQSKQ